MPRLAIDKDFLDDYSKLEKSVRTAVKDAIDKFAEHTYAGLHLEKLQNSVDDRIRTIRVDQFWRGVVLAPDSGDTYYLMKVMPHDKAIDYAASHRLTVNQALGVVEVRNEAAIEQFHPALERAAETTGERLLSNVSDSDLSRLGIDDNTRIIARLLTSEAQLDAMQQMIPETQYNALYLLAGGLSVEEVWAEVARYAPQGPFDASNVVQAMERTSDRVVFVESNDGLERILEHPFAAWRVFLHPAQRKIAYASRYAGPTQVTGGAGTGKTVTALHRAAYLAHAASEQLPLGEARKSILLTTFTRNLAEALDAQFGLLVDSADVRAQVEILNIDRLTYRIVERARGARPAIIDDKDLADLWVDAAAKADLPFTPTFLSREWEQVILAQDLHSEQDYLTCSRAGQGMPLGKAQRRKIWQLVRQVQSQLSTQRRSTFLQLANEAARLLRDSGKPPYRHVIIDEAQDLHPAQWRMLRAAVRPGPNDMFVVGDTHQRIYDNHVSLAKVGINVRGRSRRLTVNYRTTEEILALAVPTLGKAAVIGLDDETDSLTGYYSPLHGGRPEVHAAASRDAELVALTERVRGWIDEGIEAHAIGIAARANYLAEQAAAALKASGIPVASLTAKSVKDAVRVGTMHRMKGLEFQAVAVIGVADGVIPTPAAVTPVETDPLAHRQDLQRERCLLFVACTRARDHLYVSYSGSSSPFLVPR